MKSIYLRSFVLKLMVLVVVLLALVNTLKTPNAKEQRAENNTLHKVTLAKEQNLGK